MMSLYSLKHHWYKNYSYNVDVAELTGAEIMIYSSIGGQDFVARLDSRAEHSPWRNRDLAFDMNKAHFFDVETESRIRC